ncbi:MAG TPA: UvrD-helicase domain-containing protein [Streptosporangiaceae bacterium]|nr:UvrD-helicase domain-containing protein [Streptosporangiaceae bacterium]
MRYNPAQLARLLGLPPPTPEQAAVISAPLRPVAVVAGAGSGKSETMAARLVWLVANGLARPERMLGLTFTRKAAAELADRVRARLDGLRRAGLSSPGDVEGEPVVSTYHAYAGRLVADHALREALEPSMRLITPAVAWQIAAGVVAAYDGPMDAIDWVPRSVTAAVLQLAGDLAEHLCDQRDVSEVGEWLFRRAQAAPDGGSAAIRKVLACQRTREQLLPLVERYTEAKRAREVLDYGDQVALAARIAQRHPEVGAAERVRYQAVLLDEYQDTSHAQLVLLRSLFGRGHPVTAVGDPCQSIYGWRGASAGNLQRFAADFPGASTRTLSVSFRNSGRILDAAAVVGGSLRAEAPQVPRLVPAPERDRRGTVTCALLETAEQEADWVAQQVAALLRLPPGTAPDGQPWPDGRKEGVRPSDVAILCRKRTQFPLLRKALEALGIPVEVVGLGGLLTVPEVQDVVATLRVLHDPAASDALARLLTGPRWRIGPRDLIALGRRARELARTGREHAPAEEEEAADGDALAQAVADLTADAGSLIEALDDLGDPDVYSPSGSTRLSALGAELRAMRLHTSRPLADLVGEVERTLSLDIEVAARPGASPAAARADLDAFASTAAAFAADQEEPTLAAFLAYLAAAQEEEFGLEAGRVGQTDTVKLVTVHAAKGLQWPAVVVPGLSAGERSQVFPARPRQTTRWTENPRLLPFSLRGDAGYLPVLAGLDPRALRSFTADCAARELAEERRLMYVAVTRTAYWLACTGYWWGEGVLVLGPSAFLSEIRDACQEGAGLVASWAPPPAPEAENPALAEPPSAAWPVGPSGARYEAARAGAGLVRTAMAAYHRPDSQAGARRDSGESGERPGTAEGPGAQPGGMLPHGMLGVADDQLVEMLDEADQRLAAAWSRDTTLLLAERARRRGEAAEEVALPGQISVSALVTLARDAGELARQVRRPLPQPPAPQARRGTAFHRWLEQRFGAQHLIDPTDLIGMADEDPEADADLAELRARFEAGAWADRWPREVEVPFETRIGDRVVRGRIDAVFADAPADGYDVVDWKTGRPPGSAEERHAIAVQLAAYRLAWAALAGVPLDQVRAAFYYVRHDLTVSPADLLDAEGLTALIEGIPAAG